MFIDFEYEIRTDSAYRDKIYNAIDTMQKTAKEATRSEKHRKLHEEAVLDYLRASNFNITPLLGYYFPNYPEGKPYSLRDFSFAHCYYTLNLGHNSSTVFRCGRQIGKSILKDSKIKVRNKLTNDVFECTIGELFNQIATASKQTQPLHNA